MQYDDKPLIPNWLKAAVLALVMCSFMLLQHGCTVYAPPPAAPAPQNLPGVVDTEADRLTCAGVAAYIYATSTQVPGLPETDAGQRAIKTAQAYMGEFSDDELSAAYGYAESEFHAGTYTAADYMQILRICAAHRRIR